MSFRLVPKSMTLNDLERRNNRYFALFQRIRVAFAAHCVKVRARIFQLLMSSCSSLRAGVQPTLDPSAESVSRSNALAQGERRGIGR